MTEQDSASDKRLAQQLDLLAGKEVPDADPELQAEMRALRLILLEHQDSILTTDKEITRNTATAPVHPTGSGLAETIKQAIAKLLNPTVLASLAGISLLAFALPTLLTLSTPPDPNEEIRAKSGTQNNIEIVTTTPQQVAEQQLKNLFQSQNLTAKLQKNKLGQWQITSENVKLEQAQHILMQLRQQYPNIQVSKLEEQQDIILKFSTWNHVQRSSSAEFITNFIERFTANGATIIQQSQLKPEVWQIELQLPTKRSEELLDTMEYYNLQAFSNGRLVIRVSD